MRPAPDLPCRDKTYPGLFRLDCARFPTADQLNVQSTLRSIMVPGGRALDLQALQASAYRSMTHRDSIATIAIG